MLIFAFVLSGTMLSQTYKANSLEKNQYITVNQGLRSHNGQCNLIMQKDGNLCVYKNGNQFVWCAMTNNR